MKKLLLTLAAAALFAGCATHQESKAALHARMVRIHRSYTERGITNMRDWSPADRAEFTALLAEYTR